MDPAILTTIISASTGIISALIGFFAGRKKQNIENDANTIDNMQDSLTFYDDLIDSNRTRLNELLEQNRQLIEKNNQLEKEVRDLKKQVQSLIDKIDKLESVKTAKSTKSTK